MLEGQASFDISYYIFRQFNISMQFVASHECLIIRLVLGYLQMEASWIIYIYFGAILRYKNHERYQRINLLHLWHGQETPCLLHIFQVYIIRQKRKLNTMLCEGNPRLFLRDGSNTICRIRWMSLETLSLESATLRSMKVSLNLHPHTHTKPPPFLNRHFPIAKEVKGTTYEGSDYTLKDNASC